MLAAQNTRIRIIQGATEIIAKDGLSKISFDRLVKLTGISKGGILYHFASKDALLLGVVDRTEQVFIENYKTMLGNQPPHPGRALLAYLKSALEGHLGQELYAALVAITIEQPTLLNKQKKMYQILRTDILADGGDFIRQWMLVAAFDGLWIDYNSRMYGLSEAEHLELGQSLLSEARAIIEKNK